MFLIDSYTDIDELSILVTFLISNYVHSGEINEAKKTFNKYFNQLSNSKKYPYFLRNAATIFDFHKGNDLRKKAKNLFYEAGDMFGYYTTVINMSSYYIKKDIDCALTEILIAFEELQQYNAQQIHLAANNLGICYFYKKNNLEAIKQFNLSIELAKTIMPITYASINLSNVYIKMGLIEKACDCIEELEEKVKNSNLPRLKARYYYQSAFIDYVKGDYDNAYAKCELSKYHSISTTANNFLAALTCLSENIKNKLVYSDSQWNDLFSPCYLEYWTINSVDILGNDFLS